MSSPRRTGRSSAFATALRTASLAAVCTALGTTVRAETFDTPPKPAAPRPLKIAAPVEQRLPNGLRVVLAQRRGVQLVTVRLLVLSGAEVDPPRRAGSASITATLLTRGTARHSASALARAAEALGGTLESSAGWHASDVSITVSAARIDAALGLVAETVREPTFAAAELERLRAQVLDELKVAFAQPGTLASLAAEHLLFGAGAYGHPVGGTPASLPRITRADVLALHAARYRPDHAVLVLAGDLDAATALQLARRHFGAWKPATAAPRPTPSPLAKSARAAHAPSDTIIDMPNSGQAAVVVAMSLPVLGADRAAAQVTNAVLGGGYSSRLNQEIRVKRGLSYFAGSQLDARRRGGMLRAVVQTKNDSAADVVALVRGELDRLIAAPPDAGELDARKAALIGGFSRSVETTAGLAAALQTLIVAGLAPADLRTRIDAFEAVTADEVQGFAAAHFGAAHRRVVVAGEARQFADALRAEAPELVTVPANALDLEQDGTLASPPLRPQ